jgi:L-threonylcarbamoyladenylate synthase
MKKGLISNLKEISQKIEKGQIGIFPSKNGYMLIGKNQPEIATKIRETKEKTNIKPLVEVLLDLKFDKPFYKFYKKLPKQKKQLVKYFKGSEIVFANKDHGYTFARNPYEKILLAFLKKPFYASSANITGKGTSWKIENISKKLKKRVDFIFDVGQLPKQKDFTVLELKKLKLYRKGKYEDLIKELVKLKK